MTSKAYAKVNLTLDVTAKREDGYHDISSVMQTISLFDRLEFSVEDRNDGDNEIIITSSDDSLPCNESNLCHRACTLFFKEFGIHCKSVHIDIEKNIPIGAGMGGGSSDCAETLKALNRLLDINAGSGILERIGARLGADVPFFIEGGCRKAEGIGDILSDVSVIRDFYVIIAKPPDMMLSRSVYSKFDVMYAEKPYIFPPLSTEDYLSEKDHIKRYKHISNMLAPVSENGNHAISELKRKLLNLGAEAAEMTGSGPAVFAVFEYEKAARNALSELLKNTELSFTGIYRTVNNN